MALIDQSGIKNVCDSFKIIAYITGPLTNLFSVLESLKNKIECLQNNIRLLLNFRRKKDKNQFNVFCNKKRMHPSFYARYSENENKNDKFVMIHLFLLYVCLLRTQFCFIPISYLCEFTLFFTYLSFNCSI